MALSLDSLLVSAAKWDDRTGILYTYNRNQGGAEQWGLKSILNLPHREKLDLFGYSISISPSVAAVGAPGVEKQGIVALLHSDATNFWNPTMYVDDPTDSQADFGSSVAVDDDDSWCVVGSPMNNGTGRVFILSLKTPHPPTPGLTISPTWVIAGSGAVLVAAVTVFFVKISGDNGKQTNRKRGSSSKKAGKQDLQPLMDPASASYGNG